MPAAARTIPTAANFQALDLLDEVSNALSALRDLAEPTENLASVNRDSFACFFSFARRLPDTFPNLAAHAPDVIALIEKLIASSGEYLDGVPRQALFSALDALAVVQSAAIAALREASSPTPPPTGTTRLRAVPSPTDR